MNCRVAIAQTSPTLGDVHANLEEHRQRVEAASADGADLVLFPELSLTGYFLKDQTAEVALDLESEPIQRLAELSKQTSVAFGFVEAAPDGRLYNSMALCEDGAVLGVHRKVHLVGYGMFDEVRDLAPGESFEPIESRHGRFGFLTCEDAWHLGGAYLHFLEGVDAILVASASPARGAEAPGPGFASARVWETVLRSISLLSQTWLVYCNRVGFEDGVAFAGGSMAFDPFGERVARLEGLGAGELSVELDSGPLRRARVQIPLRRDEKPWLLQAALARKTGLAAPAAEEGVEPAGETGA